MGLGAEKFMGSLTSSLSRNLSLGNYTSFFTTAIFHFNLGYLPWIHVIQETFFIFANNLSAY